MKFLIPVDGSPLSLEAVRHVLKLSQAGLDVELQIAQHEEGAVAGREAVHLEACARAATEFKGDGAVPHHAVASSAFGSFISSPR